MNPPQVYMCSPSCTLLPPASPCHPSGSSQCTSPKHPVSQTGHFRSVRAFLCSNRVMVMLGFTDIRCWRAFLLSSNSETRLSLWCKCRACVYSKRGGVLGSIPVHRHPVAAAAAWATRLTRGLADERVLVRQRGTMHTLKKIKILRAQCVQVSWERQTYSDT